MMLSVLILAGMAMGVMGEAVTQFTKRWNRKPFNCGLCMTFWLSLFVALVSFNYVMSAISFIGIAIFTRQLLWRVWPTMF